MMRTDDSVTMGVVPLPSPPVSSPPRNEGAFTKLVRRLSRSRRPSAPEGFVPVTSSAPSYSSSSATKAGSATVVMAEDAKAGAKMARRSSYQINSELSKSPAPDSYFPPPPAPPLFDGQASGKDQKHAGTAAGSNEVGSGGSAPGVFFSPRSNTLSEAWSPPPRRTLVSPIKLARSKSVAAPSRPLHAQPEENEEHSSPKGSVTGKSGTRSRSQSFTNGSMPAMETTSTMIGESGMPRGRHGGVRLTDSPIRSAAPASVSLSIPASTSASGSSTAASPSSSAPQRKPSLTRQISATIARATSLRRVHPLSTRPAPKTTPCERRVLLMLADGTEEIELFAIYDVCVRASFGTTLVSVSPFASPSQSLEWVTLSRGGRVLAETQFETMDRAWWDDFDAVVIPGGAKGAERLSNCGLLQELIREFYDQGKLVGMICAGSLAASSSEIAFGSRITSHPSVRSQLENDYRYVEERVVVDRNLVTSRGPGTAIEFALTLVEILAGKEKREEVAGPMML